MNKITFTTIALIGLLGVSSFVVAGEKGGASGAFVGIQLGYGDIHEGSGYKDLFNNIAESSDARHGIIGGRAYVGYDFLPYLGLETGYTYLPTNEYRGGANGSIDFDAWTIDLFAKGTWYFTEAFGIYAKVGAAYADVKSSGNYNNIDISESHSSIRPALGAGIIYNFNKNVAMDLSWNGIWGKDEIEYDSQTRALSNVNSAAPATSLISLGISYKFTNI